MTIGNNVEFAINRTVIQITEGTLFFAAHHETGIGVGGADSG